MPSTSHDKRVIFLYLLQQFSVVFVHVLDAMARTTFQTFSARRTLAVVDNGNVVDEVNCARGAIAFAFSASNATCLTFCHDVLATAFRGTGYENFCRNGHTLD